MAKGPDFDLNQGRRIQELAAEGITYQGDSLAKDFAFNAQCFLIQNMFEIAKNTERQSPGAVVATDDFTSPLAGFKKHVETHRGPKHWHPVPAGKLINFPSGYNYISPVLSDGSVSPAEQFTTMSSHKEDNIKALMNLTPSQQAQLVPLIRLYKVQYDVDSKGHPVMSSGHEVEIVFDDFTRGSSLDRMVASKEGRLSGAGIKSFSWDWKGVNPAEIDANITANLDIHFNSVDDLFQDQARSMTDPDTYNPGQVGKASFLDLILFSPSRAAATHPDVDPSSVLNADEGAHLLYNGKFFELKAVVGWQTPPHIRVENETHDEHPLQDILRETQLPLYLQLVSHQFKFEQDGSVDLSIHFRSRLTARNDRYDILRMGGTIEETTLARLNKEKKNLDDYNDDERSQVLTDEIKEVEEDLREILSKRYLTIPDRLLHGIPGRQEAPGGYLYQAMARPVQLRALNVVSVQGGNLENNSFAQPASVEGLAQLLNDNRYPADVLAYNAAGAMAQQTQQPFGSVEFEHIGDALGSAHPEVQTLGAMAEAIHASLGKHTPSLGNVTVTAEVTVGSVRQNQSFFDYGLSVNAQTGKPNFEEWKFFEAPTVRRLATLDRIEATTTARVQNALQTEAEQTSNLLTNTSFHGDAAVLDDNGKYDKRFPVTFFLLGDLLDIVIGRFRSTDRPENRGVWWDMLNGELAFVTTDIEFYNVKALYATAHAHGLSETKADPGLFFSELNQQKISFSKEDRAKLIKPINIASIPIQYDLFLDWWVQKVVKTKRQRWYFYDFLSDLFRELVSPVLSSRCFPGLPPTPLKLTLGDIFTDADSPFSTALGWGPAYGRHGEKDTASKTSTPTNSVTDLRLNNLIPASLRATKTKLRDDDVSGEKHRTVKVLMATTLKPQLGGRYEEDFNHGIYHFILGADRGLLKRAVFNRTDAPYLAEGRVDRDRTLGANQLRELYNVSLRLYGNTVVKPGQYIYVAPYPIGFGNPRLPGTIARTLGIGGYHLVTSVHSVIDRNGYETSLTALHEAMPILEDRDSSIPVITEFPEAS